MPRANPERSFDAAVRHLFRHLNEPHQLRRNPLVRHLSHTVEGEPTGQADKNAMSQLRILIGNVARRCIEVSTSEDTNGYRQWAIATKCLLEGQRSELIAAELGISQRKFYYERAEVCKEIAIYIQPNVRVSATSRPSSMSFVFSSTRPAHRPRLATTPKPSAVTIQYYRPTQAPRTVSNRFASGPRLTSIGVTSPRQSRHSKRRSIS